MKKCPKCDEEMFAGIVCDKCSKEEHPQRVKCKACGQEIQVTHFGGIRGKDTYCNNATCLIQLADAMKADEQNQGVVKPENAPIDDSPPDVSVVDKLAAEVAAELSEGADKRAIETATAALAEPTEGDRVLAALLSGGPVIAAPKLIPPPDLCPDCHQAWEKHDFGVPSPGCPDDTTAVKQVAVDGNSVAIKLENSVFGIVARELVKVFKDIGATNYLETQMHTDDGTYVITLLRKEGKTPGMIIEERDKEIKELREQLKASGHETLVTVASTEWAKVRADNVKLREENFALREKQDPAFIKKALEKVAQLHRRIATFEAQRNQLKNAVTVVRNRLDDALEELL